VIIDAVQKVTGIICQNLSSVEVSRHQNVVQRRARATGGCEDWTRIACRNLCLYTTRNNKRVEI